MYNDKKQTKDVKFFLKSKIESAKWFIEAIESRNQTIQKIMANIISKQNAYFNSDKKQLVPMILKDLAEGPQNDGYLMHTHTFIEGVGKPYGIEHYEFNIRTPTARGVELDREDYHVFSQNYTKGYTIIKR